MIIVQIRVYCVLFKKGASHNINFPNNIKTNFQGYDLIINLFNEYSELKNSVININFNFVTFIDANFAAIIGVYIENFEANGNLVAFSNFSSKVEQVLRRNEFLTQFGYSSLSDKFDTCVPYRKFRNADKDGFQNYIVNHLMNKPDFPKMTDELGRKMVESIFEIYVNATDHGNCNFISYYPNTGQLHKCLN